MWLSNMRKLWRKVIVNPKANEIIEFWRDEIGPENWYKSSDEVDKIITKRYKTLRDKAALGELDAWSQSSESALALIILLDQFSRNIYRGTREAFATDEKARILARRAISRGFDVPFESDLRQFYYMPICHSEHLQDQIWLLKAAKDADLDANMLDFQAHHDIIVKFGRFPFRNAALGRQNTQEENKFLADGGYINFRQKLAQKLAK